MDSPHQSMPRKLDIGALYGKSVKQLSSRIAELGSDWLKDEQKVAKFCCTVVQSYYGVIKRKQMSLA